jgi:hypothetical protein
MSDQQKHHIGLHRKWVKLEDLPSKRPIQLSLLDPAYHQGSSLKPSMPWIGKTVHSLVDNGFSGPRRFDFGIIIGLGRIHHVPDGQGSIEVQSLLLRTIRTKSIRPRYIWADTFTFSGDSHPQS